MTNRTCLRGSEIENKERKIKRKALKINVQYFTKTLIKLTTKTLTTTTASLS